MDITQSIWSSISLQNDVQTAVQQHAIFLSSYGASTYQVIRNMTALDKLTDQTFKVIITLVKDRYCPLATEIAQIFTCNTRLQREEVTIMLFIRTLQVC